VWNVSYDIMILGLLQDSHLPPVSYISWVTMADGGQRSTCYLFWLSFAILLTASYCLASRRSGMQLLYFCFCFGLLFVPSVLWHCWLDGMNGIRLVKNWVVGCWHGYLSGARCRLAYSPLMPLPLTVSCSSKIQIGFTFLVPAHLGSPGKRAVKRVCVCVCVRPTVSSSRLMMPLDYIEAHSSLLTVPRVCT